MWSSAEWAKPECIDRESCDTLVKGHPKEFHVIVDHERVPQNSSNLFVHDLQKLVFSSAKIIPEITRFCCPKTVRKLGMCCVKCDTFERLWEAIVTSTMIPLLQTHIKLRGYALRCAELCWYFAHFLHTDAQNVRTQQWIIVDVIIASIVYRDRWWGGTLLSKFNM